MAVSVVSPPSQAVSGSALALFTDQVFLRTTGAPLIAGNHVRILRDAAENYPAWLEAIGSAKDRIYFENYIIGNDHVGQQMIAALSEAARRGVRVRLLYDWLGTHVPNRFWQPLLEASGEVRCFNPFRLSSPLGWLSRDHRKSICVDGSIAFVTGLCASARWMGNPTRRVAPWRDTGVELRGPAVADVEQAFAQVWATTGDRIPNGELSAPNSISPAGDIALSVVATAPAVGSLYRLDQLIATAAKKTLWLTDAYFVGVAPYVEALRAAARDGVDVRLLVPGSTDIPVLIPLTRAGYRPLLQAGVRIFEWNGSMIHAKTAVADSRWARVGSSNLNIASWMGNYELDIAVDDAEFGKAMEDMFLQDLESATEIVLNPRNRVRPKAKRSHRSRWIAMRSSGSASRTAAAAMRIGNTVGAALTNRRMLGAGEAGILLLVGATLVLIAVLGALWPKLIAVPFAILAGWIGLTVLVRAVRLNAQRNQEPNLKSGPVRSTRKRSPERNKKH